MESEGQAGASTKGAKTKSQAEWSKKTAIVKLLCHAILGLGKGYNTSLMVCKLKTCFDTISHWPCLYMHPACMRFTLCMRRLSRYIATLPMTRQTCHMSKHDYICTALTMLGRERTSSAEKQATGLLLSSYWYPRAAELRGRRVHC